MMSVNLSKEIAEKSVHAAVAAIEIYNKPDFHYREEAFSLLMTNAWELLLKAKWLLDHGERLDSLHEADSHGKARLNRSGNPCTHGLTYLAARLQEDKNSGLDRAAHDNLLGLVEVRDNSAHFIHKDMELGRRVLELGMASLQNYLLLTGAWFQIDLSRYNFYLMPLSFYHGFEAITAMSVSSQPEQVRRLLVYLDGLDRNEGGDSQTHVALRLETRLVRGKDASAVGFRWTDDPDAPTVRLSEEDVLRNYPLTYQQLVNQLCRRYEDFVQNEAFHKIKRQIEQENKLCIIRALNPQNPNSAKQKFYNTNVLREFDKHYTLRSKLDSKPGLIVEEGICSK